MKYEFKTDPWEHQMRALKASWDKREFALLCDYGTGKTKIILDNAGILFEYSTLEALFIIAPNEVHERWISEQVGEHLPERIPYIASVWTGKNTKKYKAELERFWSPKNENKLKIFSMNVEALQSSPRAKAFAKNFLESFVGMLVIDESTRIKTPGAKRTKFIVKLGESAAYKRTLTGNEITRSPFDVYTPYKFLNDSIWTGIPNFHVFKHKYGEFKTNFTYRKSIKVDTKCYTCNKLIKEVQFKRPAKDHLLATCPLCGYVLDPKHLPYKAKKLLDSGGKAEFPTLIKYKNLDNLRARTHKYSILIRKEDCMDLPEKIYQPIYTEMNPEQVRIYQELKKEMFVEYKGEELTVVNKIALSVRFQQIVGGFFPGTGEQIGNNNPKMDRMIYDLEDIDCEAPIIIWARFSIEIDKITERLKKEYPGKRTVKFYGPTPKPERKQIITDFQNGSINYFVANPMVAGTGLNLQKAYIQYYYSNSFNAEDRWQSEDRTHRGEQKENCLYKDIFIKGTVDDTIKEANDKKVSLASFFKDRKMEELV